MHCILQRSCIPVTTVANYNNSLLETRTLPILPIAFIFLQRRSAGSCWRTSCRFLYHSIAMGCSSQVVIAKLLRHAYLITYKSLLPVVNRGEFDSVDWGGFICKDLLVLFINVYKIIRSIMLLICLRRSPSEYVNN